MKISILIPLFNDEKYISRCLKSVIEQDYSNLEIIIVNDGSTDSSLKIIEEYSKKDKRIRILNQENKGICETRNQLIKFATGDYALFIDSDDYLEKNAIKTLVGNINEDYDLVLFNYRRLYQDGSYYDEYKEDYSTTVYDNYTLCKEYLFKNKNIGMVLWRRLYRKDLLKSIVFKDKQLPEDYSTAFSIYMKSKKTLHINFSPYVYFIKNDGLTVKQTTYNDYYNSYIISKELYRQEKEFFNNECEVITRINSIYINYLLTIYSNLYFLEKSDECNELMKIIELDIEKKLNVEIKTKIAIIIYKINKKLFFSIQRKREIKNRMKR